MIRRDLTPAQRAKLIAKRKAAYEAVHGSAKAVGARAANRKMGRGDAGAKLADASFTADTAAKTGKPERTIQRDATRAKALGPDLDRVVGTSLDKGAPNWTRSPRCPATARNELGISPQFRSAPPRRQTTEGAGDAEGYSGEGSSDFAFLFLARP